MAATPRPTSAARLKETLENEKLQLEKAKLIRETKFIPINSLAQFFAALLVFVAAMVILFWFQRPQVTAAELARQSNEYIQVASQAFEIQRYDNEQARLVAIKALQKSYPEHKLVAEFATSFQNLIDDRVKLQCRVANAKIATLEDALKSSESHLQDEEKNPFRSAAAEAIKVQIRATVIDIKAAKDDRAKMTCP